MSFKIWLKGLFVRKNRPIRRTKRRNSILPRLEQLEDRLVPTISIGGTNYATLQAAVAAATTGQTINIDSTAMPTGGYQGAVTINTSLTIAGPGAGLMPTIVAPTDGSLDGTHNAILDIESGADVTVSGLSLTGSATDLSQAIYVGGGSTLTLNSSLLKVVQNTNGTAVGVQVGNSLTGDAGTAFLANDTITGYQAAGIVVDGTGSSTTISDTTVTGLNSATSAVQDGIVVSNGAVATISGSTISNNTYNSGAIFSYTNSAGILFSSAGGGSSVTNSTVNTNDLGLVDFNSGSLTVSNSTWNNLYYNVAIDAAADISGNTFNSSYYGVAAFNQAGDTVNAAVTIRENTFSSTMMADIYATSASADVQPQIVANFNDFAPYGTTIDNTTSSTIDGTNNWWSSNSGPSSYQTSGPVTTSPYLVMGATMSASTVVSGQSLTLTADLTHNSSNQDTSSLGYLPDGIPISFYGYNGNASPSTVATVDGVASTTFTAGSASIPYAYGYVSANGATVTASVSITQASTTTSLSSSTNSPEYGQSVTLTATVAAVSPGSGDATGYVYFYDGTNMISSAYLSAGVATTTISWLAMGNHSITAVYQGDGGYTTSTSTAFNLQVAETTTATTVTSNANPSQVGQYVTFTAQVIGAFQGFSNPTGTVQFEVDGSNYGSPQTLGWNGQVSISISGLSTGSHTIVAIYSGDSNFLGSDNTSNPLTEAVTNSVTTVVSSLNPSQVEQNVTFAATVAPVIAGSGTPTGTVQFVLDGGDYGSPQTLDANGQATISDVSLAGGNHTITAIYSGDANFTASNDDANPLTQIVLNDTTTLTSSANPSVAGQNVTLTAAVSSVISGATVPTGSVQFWDGSMQLGTGYVDSTGTATLSLSYLPAGTDDLTAVYSGDSNYTPSTSPPLAQVVELIGTSTAVTSSANPVGVNQSLTLTATITPDTQGSGSPYGTVNFYDGTNFLGSSYAYGGVANLYLSSLSFGNHSITADFEGDSTFAPGTSSPYQQQVFSAGAVNLSSSSTGTIVYGQSVTFTASVSYASGAAAPTGTMTFWSGSINLGEVALDGTGRATLSTTLLPVGYDSIDAVYSGDSNYPGGVSNYVDQSVVQDNTTTSLSANSTSLVYSAPLTLTATVAANSPGSGTPTGSVSFYNSGGFIGSASLSNGVATLTLTYLSVGQYPDITATYNGDSNFNGSTSSTSLSVTIFQDGTTTSVATSGSPSVIGENVTFTATVLADSPGQGTPTGDVQFQINGSNYGGPVWLNNGVAIISDSSLPAGTNTITATYSGDGNFIASNDIANPLMQIVNQASTTTTLNTYPNSSVYGQSVEFMAAVESTSPTMFSPTGYVQFVVDGSDYGNPVQIGANVATIYDSALTTGQHVITAVYLGDSNFTGSTSTPVDQTVVEDVTWTWLNESPQSSVFGQPVTITASVYGSYAGTPTGTVTFMDGTNVLGTATLNSNGVATFTTSSLAVGDHPSITAVYGGDSNFTGSTSPTTDEEVYQDGTMTSLVSSENPANFGDNVTFTATVTANSPGTDIPNGMVQFVDTTTNTILGTVSLNSSGVASISTSSLAVGSHDIIATYQGTVDFGNSSAGLNEAVGDATTTTLTTSQTPSTYGQTLVFTANVSSSYDVPTGWVAFWDGTSELGWANLNNGTATFYGYNLSAGDHPDVTAQYMGDGTNNPSVSSALDQFVNQAVTTISVTSSLDPSDIGQNVTFTATITTPYGGAPTGSVQFLIDGTVYESTQIYGTQVSVSDAAMTEGSHTVEVIYSGDPNFIGSNDTSNPLTQMVINSQTSVSSDPNPSVAGQSVVLTATVSPILAGSPTPTGTVQFQVDGSNCGSPQTLDANGQATISDNSLAAGSYSITAVYSGDSNYTGSTSSAVNQYVQLDGTTTTLSGTPSSTVYSAPVVLTATVTASSPGGGTPTGNVYFYDSGYSLGYSQLNNSGVATLVTTLDVGDHPNITVNYYGDNDFTFSGSALIDETITQDGTTTSLTASANPTGYGQNETFTATVSSDSPGLGTPTGWVQFQVDGIAYGAPVQLNSEGQASIGESTLNIGIHAIAATYVGDMNFTGSDNSMSVRIDGMPPIVTGLNVTAAGGTNLTVPVATFVEPNGSSVASSYTAYIAWGDGGETMGTISANSNGTFTVSGTYNYSASGTYTITVIVVDGAGDSGTSSSTASIGTPVLSATADDLQANPANVVSGVIATFTDTDSAATLRDFAASIDWGDGTSSQPDITTGSILEDSSGDLNVVGSHTYAVDGTYTLAVTVSDNEGDSTTGDATVTVTNGVGLAVSVSASNIAPTANYSYSGTLAEFTDSGPWINGSDFTAVINWGDGSATSTGSVVANGDGSFDVSGTHTYAAVENYTFTVTVTDPQNQTGSSSSQANVTSLSMTPLTEPLTLAENENFDGIVASFANDNGLSDPTQFSATIDWGDGTTSQPDVTTGTVSFDSSGDFDVNGSHAYTTAGNFSINVTMTDASGDVFTAQTTAIVQAGSVAIAPLPDLTSVANQPFEGSLFSFADVNSDGDPTVYQASINWGDQTSPDFGDVMVNDDGTFDIADSHTFAMAGNYTVSVTLTDASGNQTTASTTLVVQAHPFVVAMAPITPTAQQDFAGTVATFTELDPNANNFYASITWGDGAVTQGSVVPNEDGSWSVFGDHTFAGSGSYTMTVTVSDDVSSQDSVTTSATVNVASDDPTGITTNNVNAAIGVATTSTPIAWFKDPSGDSNPNDFRVSVLWGDGNESVLNSTNVVSDGNGGFNVYASHVYSTSADDMYTVSVVNTTNESPTFDVTGGGDISVVPAVLLVSSDTVSGAPGQAFSGEVATFADVNDPLLTGTYSAEIEWGDGETSIGTITPDGVNGYSVQGEHTYAAPGSYQIVALVFSEEGYSGSGTATATIAVPLIASGESSDPQANQNQSFTGALATFTGPSSNIADYSASIDWGNGDISSGTIVANGTSGFAVEGTEDFASTGTFTATVTIADSAGDQTTATTNVDVAAAPIVARGSQLTGDATVSSSWTVANFTAADPNATAGEFTASINWGDGTSSSGSDVTIVNDPYEGFDVQASHTFATEGTFTATITITDSAGDQATTTTEITVSNPLVAGAVEFTSAAGLSFTQSVATINDFMSTTDNFSATINWGDGSSSPDSDILADADGYFDVQGTHAYAATGSYEVVVTISDGNGNTATAISVVNVVAPSISATGGTALAAVTGIEYDGTLATFTSTNPSAQASDFDATITWDGSGDSSSTSAGTIVDYGDGTFSVEGQYTYASAGNYPVTISITGPASSSAEVADGATVSDILVNASSLSFGTNLAFNDTVANFQTAITTPLTATINWGDGTSSLGNIVADPAGGYDVLGSHTYTSAGSFNAVVAVSNPEDASQTGSSTATNVVAASQISVMASTITPVVNQSFTGVVATFNSGDNAEAADFSASIDWGDGSTPTVIDFGSTNTGGYIVADPAGGFDVVGTHTYTDSNPYTITVSVNDEAGDTPGTDTSSVQAVPLNVAGTTGVTAQLNQQFTAVVATLQDADPTQTADDFTAVVNWGDGTSSDGTIVPDSVSGIYDIQASHAYANVGLQYVDISVFDGDGNVISTQTTVYVTQNYLQAQGTSVTAQEGEPFTGTLATIIDPNDTGISAQITWGTNGPTTDATIVTNSDNSFSVVGNYTFNSSGTIPVTVTVTDATGPATVSSSATVTAQTLTPTATGFSSAPDNSYTGTVATFTYTNPDAGADSFQATITWNDGSQSSGTVEENPDGGYSVVATSPVLATTGSLAYSVTVLGPEGEQSTSSADANVSALLITTQDGTFGQGLTFDGAVLATFQAPLNLISVSDFTATIDWGDGGGTPDTSTGIIVAGPNGGFMVEGGHTYTTDGTYTATVTLGTVDPTTGNVSYSAPVTLIATVQSASLTVVADSIDAVNGDSFTGVVGQFSVGSLPADASDFTATIDWGDGTTGSPDVTSGTVVADPKGGFNVIGTHTYTEDPPMQILVTDPNAGLNGAGNINQQPAPLAITGYNQTLSTNQSFQGIIASFQAPPAAMSTTFSAVITWGDGTSSIGRVEATPFGGPGVRGPGGWVIYGDHSYSQANNYDVEVTLIDVQNNLISTTAKITVNPTSLTVMLAPIQQQSLMVNNAVLGTAADVNLNDPTNITAQINWGDTRVNWQNTANYSVGSVTAAGSIMGTHKYANPGTYTETVRLTDNIGAITQIVSYTTTVTVSSSLTITNAPDFYALYGQTASGTLLTFSDAIVNPGNYTATINWGDGSSNSQVNIPGGGAGGAFSLPASHTYTSALSPVGSYRITVTIVDNTTGDWVKSATQFAFVGYGVGTDQWTGAAGDNNWNTPGNWSAGVPSWLTNVVIGPGYSITAPGNVTVNSLMCASSLTVNGNLTITGTPSTAGMSFVYGFLQVNGNLSYGMLQGQDWLILGGGGLITGTVSNVASAIVLDGGTFNFTSPNVNLGMVGVTQYATLNLSQGMTATTLDLEGGVVSGAAGTSLTVSNNFIFNGGTLSGATVQTQTLSMTGPVTLTNSSLTSNGNGTWNGGTVTSQNSSFTTNGALIAPNGGTWNGDARSSFNVIGNGNPFTSGSFVAQGRTTLNVPIYNSGTITAYQTTLRLTGGTTPANPSPGTFCASPGYRGATINFAAGSYSISGTVNTTTGTLFQIGRMEFTGANVTISGVYNSPLTTITAGLLSFGGAATASTNVGYLSGSGALGGTGTFTINSKFFWTGGTMQDAGITAVAAGASMVIQDPGNGTTQLLTLQNGRVLSTAGGINQNSGTIDWIGNGGINTVGTASIINSGNFLILGNGTLSGSGLTIFNQGTMTKMAVPVAGVTNIQGALVNNSIVNILQGTLRLTGGTGGFNSTGTFNIPVGATLDFAGGTFTLTTDLTPQGTIVFSGSSVTLNGAYTAPTLNISGGTSTFNGELTFDTLNISGGRTTFTNPFSCDAVSLTNQGVAIFTNTYDVPTTTINGGIGIFSNTYTSTTTTINAGKAIFNGSASTEIGTMTGGVLGGRGVFTIDCTFTWSGGIMTGSGVTELAADAQMTLESLNTSTQLILNSGRTLNNDGTVTWNGAGALATTRGAAEINNWSTFTINAGGLMTTGNLTFNNYATLIKADPSLTTLNGPFNNIAGAGANYWGAAFNSPAYVAILEGQLALGGGGSATGTANGAFIVSANAALQFTGGSYTLNASAAIVATAAGSRVDFIGGTVTVWSTYAVRDTSIFNATVIFNANAQTNQGEMVGGTLSGPGTFTINNIFLWSGGIMQGPGTTVVARNTGQLVIFVNDLNISNAEALAPSVGLNNGRILNNQGNTTLTGTGSLSANLNTSPTITNSATVQNQGTFTFAGDVGLTGANLIFNNLGTVQLARAPWAPNNAAPSETDTTVASIGGVFNNPTANNANASQVVIPTGVLVLSGGGSSAGTFSLPDSGTGSLQFTANYTSTGTITAPQPAAEAQDPNLVLFAGGNVQISGTYSVYATSIQQSGQATFNISTTLTQLLLGTGTLCVAPGCTVDVSSSFQWSAGLLTGGGTFTIDRTATMATPNGAAVGAQGIVFNNNGKAVFDPSTLVEFRGGVTFTNGAGAEMIVSDFVTISGRVGGPSGPGDSMLNNGTITREGSNASTIFAVYFTNNGTVNIKSGQLVLENGGAGDGAWKIAANATLELQNINPMTAQTNTAVVGGAAASGGAVSTYEFRQGTSFGANAEGDFGSNTGMVQDDGAVMLFAPNERAVAMNSLMLFNGTLQGIGSVSINTMYWIGGTMSGSGATTINYLYLVGGVTLNGRILNINTVTWAGQGFAEIPNQPQDKGLFTNPDSQTTFQITPTNNLTNVITQVQNSPFTVYVSSLSPGTGNSAALLGYLLGPWLVSSQWRWVHQLPAIIRAEMATLFTRWYPGSQLTSSLRLENRAAVELMRGTSVPTDNRIIGILSGTWNTLVKINGSLPIPDVLGAIHYGEFLRLFPVWSMAVNAQEAMRKYQQQGVPDDAALIVAIAQQLPLTSSFIAANELISGQSLQADDLGRQLTGTDYAFRIVTIGFDVAQLGPVGRIFGRALGRVGQTASVALVRSTQTIGNFIRTQCPTILRVMTGVTSQVRKVYNVVYCALIGGCFVGDTLVLMVEEDEEGTEPNLQNILILVAGLGGLLIGSPGFIAENERRKLLRRLEAVEPEHDNEPIVPPPPPDPKKSAMPTNEQQPVYYRPEVEGDGETQPAPERTKADSQHRSQQSRTWHWFGRLIVFAGVLMIGFAALRIVPSWFGQRAHHSRLAKPISQVKVGERVLTEGPGHDDDLEFGEDVDSTSWRKVVLRAPKDDGSISDVVLLRPMSWLREEQAAVGGRLDLDFPECGITGPATIIAIEPCPPIKRGSGGVVTGTFKHHSAQILNVYIEGESSPIGTTPNHLFWSEDRRAFVRADELRAGEQLWGHNTGPRVRSIELRSEGEAVYNLEIQTVHVYHVSSLGVLVHNSTSCPRIARVLETAGISSVDNATLQTLRTAAVGNNRALILDELTRIAPTLTEAQIEQTANRLLQEGARGYDFGALDARLRGAADTDIKNAHAHHILFKKGIGEEQQKLVLEGQKILRSVGIDPIYGKENLVWAPNIKGQHTLVNLEEVVTALRTLQAQGGTKTQFAKLLQKLGKKAAGIE